MDRVETLSNEALELGIYLLRGECNRLQAYAAADRIETICREIGGTPRELMNNAQIKLNATIQQIKETGI
jgi:hypothetical protein